jgi:hypothetical protein
MAGGERLGRPHIHKYGCAAVEGGFGLFKRDARYVGLGERKIP